MASKLFKLDPNQVPVFRPVTGLSFGHTSEGHIYRNERLHKDRARWFLTLGDDNTSHMTDLVLLLDYMAKDAELRPLLEQAVGVSPRDEDQRTTG